MKKLEIFFRESPKKPVYAALIALFWVVFLWGFWDKGFYALGFNMAIWLFLVLMFLDKCTGHKGLLQRKNLFLLIPLLLIILSFAIYDNPFIKIFSILFFPVLLTISLNYAFLDNRQNKIWGFGHLLHLASRIFSPFAKLKASSLALGQIIRVKTAKFGTLRSIALGLAIFSILALGFIIPLLSSADSLFEQKLSGLIHFFENIISAEVLFKIIVFYVIALLLYAFFLAWAKPLDIKDASNDNKKTDSIVVGMVIGGTLLLYLLFLWIQFERIWVTGLPAEFKDVEILVKSGFWQMMGLSIINIIIFFFTYKRTNKTVQIFLSIFTVASLLLLASAAYRMFLYINFYGLSHEKFFAAYTIVFCILMFCYLLSRVLTRARLNIFKFLVFLFMWMFAFISVMPIDQFILRTNIYLAQKENSRIDLYESRILSADVLLYIDKFGDTEFMKVNNKDEDVVDWSSWREEQKASVEGKKWYELNFVNLLYLIKR